MVTKGGNNKGGLCGISELCTEQCDFVSFPGEVTFMPVTTFWPIYNHGEQAQGFSLRPNKPNP